MGQTYFLGKVCNLPVMECIVIPSGSLWICKVHHHNPCGKCNYKYYAWKNQTPEIKPCLFYFLFILLITAIRFALQIRLIIMKNFVKKLAQYIFQSNKQY